MKEEMIVRKVRNGVVISTSNGEWIEASMADVARFAIDRLSKDLRYSADAAGKFVLSIEIKEINDEN